MVTLKDIARLVGVSVPTVSKVLNNKSQKCASPETQNRIWQAVHDLGYTPNVHAKKLASISGIQTMKNIVAIYLWEDQPPFLANFYQAIRKKLEVALLSNKYIPYTCDLDVIFKKESPIPEQQIVAVVIIGEPSPKVVSYLSKAISNVLVLSLEDGMIGCDKVFCGFNKAVRETISLAFKKNSGMIFYVGSEESPAVSICSEYRGEAHVHVVCSDCTVSGGYIAGLQIKEYASEGVQVICEGKEIATGIQKAFSVEGIPVNNVQFLVLDDTCSVNEDFVYDGILVDFGSEDCVNLGLKLLLDRIKFQHNIPVVYEMDNLKLAMGTGEKE